MRYIYFSLLAMLSILLLISCSAEKQAEVETSTTQETVSTTSDDSMLECDGSCSMEMQKSEMVAYEEDGKTLHFCSEGCKTHYLASKEAEESEAKEM